MTVAEYTKKVLSTYRLVRVLADKNGSKALHLRHKTLEKDLVLHQFPQVVAAYDLLVGIRAENLPEVYDAICLEDGQVVLEEYISGMTVADVIAAGRYRYRGARRVLRAVCAGLSVLHAKGLVHRDIKPENIIVDPSGRVVLIDFNASRQYSPGKRDTEVLGTVGYASPEQMGISQSDRRTDIYAAGVLLNVMLTGLHPSERIAPGRAGRIIRKCTQVHPGDRYQSAEMLAHAL